MAFSQKPAANPHMQHRRAKAAASGVPRALAAVA
jgi:hypothetical protein